MIISELKAFDLLTLKFNLPEKDARQVVAEFRRIDEGIRHKVKEEINARENIFLTKDDKVELIDRIEKVRVEMEKTRTDMEKTRSDLIKWMFIFWIGQLAAIFGMFKVFFT